MRTPLRLANFKLVILCCLSIHFAPFSQAQITGGQISFSNNYLVTNSHACLKDCSSSYCQKDIYNFSFPTGGSNRYNYSWQVDSGTGWKPLAGCCSPCVDSTAWVYTCLKQPMSVNVGYRYRRMVKNQLNPNDSAFSNVVTTQAHKLESGYLQFSNNSSWASVQVGTTPPYIRALGAFSTDGNAAYFFDRLTSQNYWQQVGYEFNYSGATYQPPTQDTTGSVEYRGQLGNPCPYDDAPPTSSVYLYFIDTLFINGGKIAEIPTSSICRGSIVQLTSLAAPQLLPPYTYQWQFSTNSWQWNDIPNATNITYTDSSFSQAKYYRRMVKKGIFKYYSNVITVFPGSITVDPNVFGNNRWNIYCYAGTNLNLITNTYLFGYYTSDSLNIKTANDWASNLSPSSAQNYTGCVIDSNNFTIVTKRRGFKSGSYVVQIPAYNGSFSIYVNGYLIYDDTCCNNALPYLNVGKLNSSSTIEIRHSSTLGKGNLEVNFIKLITRPSMYNTDSCRTLRVMSSTGNRYTIKPINLIDSIGLPIASINPKIVKLGLISVSMKHSPPGSSNIPVDGNGVYYMPRYYNFSSSSYGDNNFPSPLRIKLLFLNSEFDDYKNALNKPLLTLADLRVLHYDGSNEDCDRSNNTAAGVLLTPVDTGSYGSDGFYLEVEVSSFSEFGVIANNSPLPLHWLSVSAAKKRNNILVQWKVAKEDQTKRYEVLRSYNGSSYSIAGIVERKSIPSSPAAYTFTDPVLEKSYYLYYPLNKST